MNDKPEGTVRFHAQPSPDYDPFEKVLISVRSLNPGGGGAWCVWRDHTVDEARALAAEILRACDIVERQP